MNATIKKIANSRVAYWIICFCISVYGALSIYLFFNQTLYPATGLFESDLPFHISMAVDDHWYYSFTAYVYVFLSRFSLAELWIGCFLGAVSVFTVFATARLLERLAERYNMVLPNAVSLGLGLTLNLVMAFYIPIVNSRHYIGYQSANLFHNSTYHCMKLFAILSLLVLLDLVQVYEQKSEWRLYVQFTLLLFITTGIKPSFLMAFAPVLAGWLLLELIRKKKFLPVFALGCTVLPSLGVVLWQSLVLFGGETGNGYEIRPFYVLSQRSDHAKVAVICSVAFLLEMILYHIRDFYKDKLYLASLWVFLVGFLEVFLFAETGSRSLDGNFLWGYYISMFVLLVASAARLLQDFREVSKLPNKKARACWLCLCTLTLLYQAICGLWYFELQLTGVGYFA
jgi:hypothetical protein